MNTDHRPQAAEHLTRTPVGDELLVLDESAGQIHQLNSSAALVLDACDGTATVHDIEARLQQTFGIDADVARHDVSSVLEDLKARQLLVSQ